MASTASLVFTKPELRRQALARRDALPPDLRISAAQAVASRPLPVDLSARVVVSGFLPVRSEIDCLPLMRRLADCGARLALPVVQRPGTALRFRAYAFGDQLSSGPLGLREPLPEAIELIPDILFVPLAAFDRSGHRIGYGAGYYDLTLFGLRAEKPVVAIGLGFAAQEIAAVPATPRDARLDLVLTERELIDCRGA